MNNTFCKDERLYKRTLIERLFSRESSSFTAFPLRVIFLPCENINVNASILISVSKRRFKRAVKRNRIKRQIREAYRCNKDLLKVNTPFKHWLIAFVYISDELLPSEQVADAVKAALQNISKK